LLNSYAPRPHSRFRALALAILHAWTLLLASEVGVLAAAVTEYEVKAAYIFNLAQFVTWPSSAFDSAQSPMRICVVGSDAFSAVLEKTVENEAVGGHPLVVDNVRSPDMLRRCHLAFVPAAHNDADSVLRATTGRAVLTVGETATFLEAGGIVRFVVAGGRVRFDVNLPQAAAGGLEVGSRVLQVARYVRR
jgi:hypothetical protein